MISEVSNALADAIGDNRLSGPMALPGASVVLSGTIDNIPCVATMAAITSDLVQHMGGAGDHVMWLALALSTSAGTFPSRRFDLQLVAEGAVGGCRRATQLTPRRLFSAGTGVGRTSSRCRPVRGARRIPSPR